MIETIASIFAIIVMAILGLIAFSIVFWPVYLIYRGIRKMRGLKNKPIQIRPDWSYSSPSTHTTTETVHYGHREDYTDDTIIVGAAVTNYVAEIGETADDRSDE